MKEAKLTITLSKSTVDSVDELVRQGRYDSRSHAIQEALDKKTRRLGRAVLAAECAKLDRDIERDLAEEGLVCGQEKP